MGLACRDSMFLSDHDLRRKLQECSHQSQDTCSEPCLRKCGQALLSLINRSANSCRLLLCTNKTHTYQLHNDADMRVSPTMQWLSEAFNRTLKRGSGSPFSNLVSFDRPPFKPSTMQLTILRRPSADLYRYSASQALNLMTVLQPGLTRVFCASSAHYLILLCFPVAQQYCRRMLWFFLGRREGFALVLPRT